MKFLKVGTHYFNMTQILRVDVEPSCEAVTVYTLDNQFTFILDEEDREDLMYTLETEGDNHD